MNSDQETEMMTKVRDMHTFLIGDALHGKKGMVQEHEENKLAIKAVEQDMKEVKSWRDNVKLRFAFTAGAFITVWEGIKFGMNYISGSH